MKNKRILCLSGLMVSLGIALILFSLAVPKGDSPITVIGTGQARQAMLARMHIDPSVRDMFSSSYAAKCTDVAVQPLEYAGELLGYVIEFSEVGYALVSGDPETTPIIAWSKGRFDYDSFCADIDSETANPLFIFIREDLRNRKMAIKEDVVPEEIKSKNRNSWDSLIQKGKAIEKGWLSYIEDKLSGYAWADGEEPEIQYWPRQGTTHTGGWIETEWHQNEPYNNFCPMDPETRMRSVTGCTATALAQVINYHQYISGFLLLDRDEYTTGTRGIEIDNDSGERDFPPFDELNRYLDDIERKYGSGEELDETDMSALSFVAGVVVRADYTSDQSGAFTQDAYSFLVDEFDYNAELYSERRLRHLNDFQRRVLGIIQDNIRNAMPVLLDIGFLRGRNAESQHLAICDGYNTNGEYHINFGWGNSNNTMWYSLPQIVYEEHEYNLILDMIANIMPMSQFLDGEEALAGEITGTVTLDAGDIEMSLEDVEIVIKGENGAVFRRLNPTVSDGIGSYSVSVYAGRRYNIECYRSLYKVVIPDLIVSDVVVGEGDTVRVDLDIVVSPGDFVTDCEDVVSREDGISYIASWIDYNSDNYQDLYIGRLNENILYQNNRDGAFSKIEDSTLVNITDSKVMSWGDYDNDGDLDLFSDGVEANYLFSNNGNGTFRRVEGSVIVNDRWVGPRDACWGDYDNDGDLDLFVANFMYAGQAQRNYVYRNEGNGVFVKIAQGNIVNRVDPSTSASWIDYDNDGYMDLFVTNSYGWVNFLYRNNNRDGTFTESRPGFSSNGQCWGDYDNDGDLDLFMANGRDHRNEENNYLYQNNGDGTFTKIREGDIVNERGIFCSPNWGDYDNDGWLDIFVGNQNGRNLLYHNNGDGTFTKIIEGDIVSNNYTAIFSTWGDYNNDGYPDLFAANRGRDALYRNLLSGNNWTKIRCQGITNRFGIGAKIYLTANINGRQTTQMRQVDGDLTLVGLGDAELIDMIRVEWPGGIVTEYPGPWNIAGRIIALSENDNRRPRANDLVVSTNEDTPVRIQLEASDPNGGGLRYMWVSLASNGVLSYTNEPSVILCEPDPNFHGQDSFTYKVNDGVLDSNIAAVSITVNPVNDIPRAFSQEVTTQEDTSCQITLAGADADGDRISYLIVNIGNNPSHGTLSGNTPNLTYTPSNNYFGADSFQFKVNDGQVDSNTSVVTITIQPVNDPPILNPIGNKTTKVGRLLAFRIRADDIDNQAVSYGMRNMPPGSSFNRRSGLFRWIPRQGQRGIRRVTFIASDGNLTDEEPIFIRVL